MPISASRNMKLTRIMVRLAACVMTATVLARITPPVLAAYDTTSVYYKTVSKNIEPKTEDSARWPFMNFGISQKFVSGHPGIDLTNPAGTVIRPIRAGRIEYAGWDATGYGNCVRISHDNGLSSLYAHLSQISVSVGDEVSRESEIGTVGATGFSTGSHLHLEITDNGIPVNPAAVLPSVADDLNPNPAVVSIAPQLPPLSL